MMRTQTSWLAIGGLAAALMVPCAAQQTQPQQDQTTAQAAAQTSNSTQAAEQESINKANQVEAQPLKPQTHEGFWGRINPFARKKYVNKQLQPVRNRLNELDELTADNAKQLSRVDAETRAGIQQAQSRADQANQEASSAAQQAQETATKAQQLDQQVNTVQTTVENVDQYHVAQTAQINFRPGTARLNAAAQQSLDQFLAGLANQKGYIVEVQAFSAGRGMRAMENSQRLADTVVRYLVLQHNIPLYRIYTMGMGNAPVAATSTGTGEAHLTRGGRVDIRILHNDLAGAAPQPASQPAANSQQQPPL